MDHILFGQRLDELLETKSQDYHSIQDLHQNKVGCDDLVTTAENVSVNDTKNTSVNDAKNTSVNDANFCLCIMLPRFL